MAEEIIFSEYQAEVFNEAEMMLRTQGYLGEQLFEDTYVLQKRVADWVINNVPIQADGSTIADEAMMTYNGVLGIAVDDAPPPVIDNPEISEPVEPEVPVSIRPQPPIREILEPIRPVRPIFQASTIRPAPPQPVRPALLQPVRPAPSQPVRPAPSQPIRQVRPVRPVRAPKPAIATPIAIPQPPIYTPPRLTSVVRGNNRGGLGGILGGGFGGFGGLGGRFDR